MLLFIRRKRKVILYNYIACNEGSLIGPTEVETYCLLKRERGTLVSRVGHCVIICMNDDDTVDSLYI